MYELTRKTKSTGLMKDIYYEIFPNLWLILNFSRDLSAQILHMVRTLWQSGRNHLFLNE